MTHHTKQLKLKPIGDKIIVTLIKKDTVTKSGIVLSSADSSEANKAKVVAVGRDVTHVAVGDTILPNWQTAAPTTFEGDNYYIVKESEIVLIFGEDEPE